MNSFPSENKEISAPFDSANDGGNRINQKRILLSLLILSAALLTVTAVLANKRMAVYSNADAAKATNEKIRIEIQNSYSP
jgi:cell division protein FtsB